MSTSSPPAVTAAPPGPVADPRGAEHRSVYWWDTLDVVPRAPLVGTRVADVCVVGGGYTGLWTSWFLRRADPDLDVVVLEREHAGAGASGHNDGFVTPTVGHGLPTLSRAGDDAQVAAAAAQVGRSILEIRRFCRTQRIDADLEASGVLMVATNEGQVARIEEDRAIVERVGLRAPELLRGAAARERVGSPAIVAAMPTGGALVNPFKLARGLADAVERDGTTIHEGTAALSITREGGTFVVRTPRGEVRARRVVLATNAYQHEFREHRRDVAPVWSYAMVSDPLTDEQLARVSWEGREGIVEARNFVVFARLTAENRLLIGGGPAPYHRGRDMTDQHLDAPGIFGLLRAHARRYFPMWDDLTYSHAYGGCVAMTRDLVPHVGRRADGVVYAHGYCGNGIAMTHAAAKAVRDLVLDRDSDDVRQLYVRERHPGLPPEPVLALGARAVSRALRWQDEHPGRLRGVLPW